MTSRAWSFQQKLGALTLLVTVVLAVVGGGWELFKFYNSNNNPPSQPVTAVKGVAVGRDLVDSTVTVNNGSSEEQLRRAVSAEFEVICRSISVALKLGHDDPPKQSSNDDAAQSAYQPLDRSTRGASVIASAMNADGTFGVNHIPGATTFSVSGVVQPDLTGVNSLTSSAFNDCLVRVVCDRTSAALNLIGSAPSPLINVNGVQPDNPYGTNALSTWRPPALNDCVIGVVCHPAAAALNPIGSASALLINVSWAQPDNSYGDAALHAWQSPAPFLNGNGVGSDHPYGLTASITSAAPVNEAGLRSPIGTTLNPAAMQVDLTGVTSFTASALGGGGLPRPSFGTLSASVVQVDLTVVTPFTASVIGSDGVARVLSDFLPLGTRSPALNDCTGRVICDPTGTPAATLINAGVIRTYEPSSALVNSIGSRLDNPYGDQFGVNAAMFATRSPSINGDGLLRPYSEVLSPTIPYGSVPAAVDGCEKKL